jgi:hypothetical protein
MEDQEMQRSTDRILTTHVGSLPRPSDLDAMLRAREAGQSSDQAEFPDFQPPEGSTLNTRRMVCIGPLAWKDRTGGADGYREFSGGAAGADRGCPVSKRPALGIRDGAGRGDAATGAASRE